MTGDPMPVIDAGSRAPRVRSKPYVYALGWRILNRVYDPLLRLTMPDRRFKSELIAAAHMQPGDRLLDLGCGTGTLLLMAHDVVPGLLAAGVDGDTEILRISQRKARKQSRRLSVIAALADALPFAPATFDRVLTTLVMHHLEREAKLGALREAWRVLKPDGELHIADFGRPHTLLMRLASIAICSFDGRHTTRDNLEGRLPEFCVRAGFGDVEERRRWTTVFGTLSVYVARKGAVAQT